MTKSLKLLAAASVAMVTLGAIVLTGDAVIGGFVDSGQVNTTVANNFRIALNIFAVFASIIVLALVGKVIVGIFRGGE